MDKVKFWKGGDDLDLDADLPPIGSPFDSQPEVPPQENFGSDSPSLEPKPLQLDDFAIKDKPGSPGSFNQGFQGSPAPGNDIGKSLDLISSKLDTIKAELDSLNQRIMNLERLAAPREKKDGKFFNKDPWGKY